MKLCFVWKRRKRDNKLGDIRNTLLRVLFAPIVSSLLIYIFGKLPPRYNKPNSIRNNLIKFQNKKKLKTNI